MTQENKELLQRDLCARLPYGVKMFVPSWDEREMEYIDRIDILYSINSDNYVITANEYYDFCIEDVKPYLFPISSMTEEQWKEYQTLKMTDWVEGDINGVFINAGTITDWLNKNHFDYRGLIPMGLAIDATELNIY